MRTREARYVALVVALVTLPAVAAVATSLLLTRQLPRAAPPEEPFTIEIEADRTTERRPAVFTARFSDARTLYSPFGGGLATAVYIEAGTELADGARVVQVDGIDRLALHAPAPPWRDLRAGDRGDDVAALQSFLARQGLLEAQPDGILGGATVQAVRELGAALGFDRPQAVAGRDWFVWLPEDPFAIGGVAVAAGGTVPASGAELAVEARHVDQVALTGIEDEPLALEQGIDYVAHLDDVQGLAVDTTAGPPMLDRNAAASLDADHFDAEGLATGFVERRTPVEVASVPATAVLTGAGGSTCVFVAAEDGTTTATGVVVAGSRGTAALVSEGLTAGQRVVANPRASVVASECH